MKIGKSSVPASRFCARPPAELQSSLLKRLQSTLLKSRRSRSSVLRGEDGLPTDAAIAVADDIHHLLVDEFQDTSRRQHRAHRAPRSPHGPILHAAPSSLSAIRCSPSTFSATPMPSSFRRVKTIWLRASTANHILYGYPCCVPISAPSPRWSRAQRSFRESLRETRRQRSRPSPAATPARDGVIDLFPRLTLHTEFMPLQATGDSSGVEAQRRKQAIRQRREAVLKKQTADIVETRSRIHRHD